MAEIRHVENRHTSLFSAEGGPIWIKFRKLVQNDMSTADCDGVIEIETRCKIPIWRMFGRIQWHVIPEPSIPHYRVLPPGEFNVMIPELPVTLQGAATWRNQWLSSQSHVSHCRVLPLGEFTVMIPEPHATLQGAVTWRNQCYDRATVQGVRIPSAILKIVFRHILFFAINAV